MPPATSLLIALLSGPGPAPAPAPAQAKPIADLPCPRARVGQVQVDGFFEDWKGPGLERVRYGEGKDLALELMAARDESFIYVVVGARDDAFQATPQKGGKGGDRVRIRFEGGPALEVLPGNLEDRLPTAKWTDRGKDRRQRPAIRVNGATRPEGWILEIGIPEPPTWASSWRVQGMRMHLEVVDDDGDGSPETHALPLKLAFPEGALSLGFLMDAAKLPGDRRPDRELHLNVGGDARRERVMTFGATLAVLGEGLGRSSYFLMELPFGDEAVITGLRSHDLNGDGRLELLVDRRHIDDRGHIQDFLHIVEWTAEGLHPLLDLEVLNEAPGGGRVENSVRIGKRPRRPGWARIHVRALPAKGVTEATYQDPDAGYEIDYQPILLPWGWTKRLSYEEESGTYLRPVR